MNDKKRIKNQKSDPYAKKLFFQVFTGMQGRYTRLKIIMALAKHPLNINELSRELGYDYKSIQRNIQVLEKYNLIEKTGQGYGSIFFLSDLLLNNLVALEEVIKKVDKKLSSKKVYID